MNCQTQQYEDFSPSPYVLRRYAKDMETNTRLIDGDIAPYLKKCADWIEAMEKQRYSLEKWLAEATLYFDRADEDAMDFFHRLSDMGLTYSPWKKRNFPAASNQE